MSRRVMECHLIVDPVFESVAINFKLNIMSHGRLMSRHVMQCHLIVSS